ncbi:PepSY domain-containing protein [Erythrobacter litoralis]|uniref:PepSY-associated TM helix domain-containing protein n=1 Tax=Erythrobacter litoralis TaxID=39960 RepID=UPI0024354A34|nr:PepSY domain-containing protein [Erythrobacter litoralis]MDG6077718.1 PepSY domain-containing protein [Erythrobacter litoralis]
MISSRTTRRSLYQAIWRWHFLAGLLTLPFLLWLAITGSIYLFEDEIEFALHGPVLKVPATPDRLPTGQLIETAENYSGHPAKAFLSPSAADRSAEILVAGADGAGASVFIDPGTGKVLGMLDGDWRVAQFVRSLHGLALFGPIANGVIEAVAGWVVILCSTGLYLWWQRREAGGLFAIRGSLRSRRFWRDLHAVLGAGVAIFGIFLAITGLMWSGVWGSWVHNSLRAIGQGVPSVIWDAPPTSDGKPSAQTTDGSHQHPGELSWTVRGMPEPRSAGNIRQVSIGLAEAARVAELQGISDGYRIDAPGAPDGIFAATNIPDKAAGIRVIQINQFSGEVVNDFSFSDYGDASQAIEWGVSLHMGKEYGRFSQWLMFFACLTLIGLTIAAIMSWMMRRKRGELGTPPYASKRAGKVGVLVILLGTLTFPLTALSAIILAGIDWALQARRTRPSTA